MWIDGDIDLNDSGKSTHMHDTCTHIGDIFNHIASKFPVDISARGSKAIQVVWLSVLSLNLAFSITEFL